MNQQTRNIKYALAKFAAKYGPSAIVPATITSVNDDDTVSVQLSNEVTLDDVRLRSVVKEGNKILMIPKVGSVVQIARIENSDEFIVIAVEEISKFLLVIGTATFDMDDSGFLVKNDAEDLLQLISDLITAIEEAIYITPSGNTTGMLPSTITILNGIKTRFNTLLKAP